MQQATLTNFLKSVRRGQAEYDEALVEEVLTTLLQDSEQVLSLLESHQYLENYLLQYFWQAPQSEPSSHRLSTFFLINFKFALNLDPLQYLQHPAGEAIFRNLTLSILEQQQEWKVLPPVHRDLSRSTQHLLFLNNHIQHLEKQVISQELLPMVSPVLQLFHSKRYLKQQFLLYPQQLREYKVLLKNKEQVVCQKSTYLDNLLSLFLEEMQNHQQVDQEDMQIEQQQHHLYSSAQNLFFLAVLQLLLSVMQQLRGRRYLKGLLEKHQFLVLLQHSRLCSPSITLYLEQLLHFYNYPINEQKQEEYSHQEQQIQVNNTLSQVQQYLHGQYGVHMTFSQISSMEFLQRLPDKKNNVADLLRYLNVSDLNEQLYQVLRVGVSIQEVQVGILKGVLQQWDDRLPQNLNKCPLLPTERDLYSCYNGQAEHSLPALTSTPLPSVNLQFLSIQDYLARNHQLLKVESAYQVRQDLEAAVNRMCVDWKQADHSSSKQQQQPVYNGWSRMASPVESFVIHHIGEPRLGEQAPSQVVAEVCYDHSDMQGYVHKEWDELQPGEVLYLVTLQEEQNDQTHSCILHLRAAELTEQFDEKNQKINKLSNPRQLTQGYRRKMHLLLDPEQYRRDVEEQVVEQVYGQFHLLLRRQRKENVYKQILQSIAGQAKNKGADYTHSPLVDLFLGYPHPMLKQQQENKQNMEQEEPCQSEPSIELTDEQQQAISTCLHQNLTLIEGAPGTGKTEVALEIVNRLTKHQQQEHPRVLIISQNKAALEEMLQKLEQRGQVDMRYVLRMGGGRKKQSVGVEEEGRTVIVTGGQQQQSVQQQVTQQLVNNHDYSPSGRIEYLSALREDLLQEVHQLQQAVGSTYCSDFTIETALLFYNWQVLPRIRGWLKQQMDVEQKEEQKEEVEQKEEQQVEVEQVDQNVITSTTPGGKQPNFPFSSFKTHLSASQSIAYIHHLFSQLQELKQLEMIRNRHQKEEYLLLKYSRVVLMTATHAAMKQHHYQRLGFAYDTLIVEEACQILDIHIYLAVSMQRQSQEQEQQSVAQQNAHIILLGDNQQLTPIVKHPLVASLGLKQSLFTRLRRLNVPSLLLTQQGRCRESLLRLVNKADKKDLPLSLPHILRDPLYSTANRGFLHTYQFVQVEGVQTQPQPSFYQNLEEAEYAVALYMYMVMQGVQPERIAILTPYRGQKYLIRDILHQKCHWNHFRRPLKVTTVDNFQGQQADYVVLSLVRSNSKKKQSSAVVNLSSLHFLRDPRRLQVAFSRARLGLYVLGNFQVISQVKEQEQVLQRMQEKGLQLQLVRQESSGAPFRREGESLHEWLGRKQEKDQSYVQNVQDYHGLYGVVRELVTQQEE